MDRTHSGNRQGVREWSERTRKNGKRTPSTPRAYGNGANAPERTGIHQNEPNVLYQPPGRTGMERTRIFIRMNPTSSRMDRTDPNKSDHSHGVRKWTKHTLAITMARRNGPNAPERTQGGTGMDRTYPNDPMGTRECSPGIPIWSSREWTYRCRKKPQTPSDTRESSERTRTNPTTNRAIGNAPKALERPEGARGWTASYRTNTKTARADGNGALEVTL